MEEKQKPAHQKNPEEPTRKQFAVLVEAIGKLVASSPEIHGFDADPRGITAAAEAFSRKHPNELRGFLEAARAVPGFGHWWEPVACLTEILGTDLEACLAEMERLETAHPGSADVPPELRSFGEAWGRDRALRLARSLVFAAREFEFSAPLAASSGASRTIEIGGPRRLRLVFHAEETAGADGLAAGGPRVTLDGTVRAMSFAAASAVATEVAEEILGLGAVLGFFEITRFNPSRRHDARSSLSLGTPPAAPRPFPIRGPYLDATLGAKALPPSAPDGPGPSRAHTEACLRKVAIGSTVRADQLRSASRFFLQGVAGDDAAQAILSLFTCLEATLLEQEKNEAVTARLTEAVAFRLGRSASDRDAIRKRLKKLYDFRSRVVHQGDRTIGWESLDELAALARAVLAREVEELEELEEEAAPAAG